MSLGIETQMMPLSEDRSKGAAVRSTTLRISRRVFYGGEAEMIIVLSEDARL